MLGIESAMEQITPGTKLRDFECALGRELGVVRVSLGLGTNWQDVSSVIEFAELMRNEDKRKVIELEWSASDNTLLSGHFKS